MNWRAAGIIALMGLAALVASCSQPEAPSVPTANSLNTLQSYRWVSDLRADSTLFDQNQAPAALRTGPFTLRVHVEGERLLPDREHAVTTVQPAAVDPRESIIAGTQRWNRVLGGSWAPGEDAFPTAKAYFGTTATLSARAILEPRETSAVTDLRDQLASMPYREETVATGVARRYTLRPQQVAAIVNDPELNPFPVLKSMPAVRIDFWVHEARRVIVGLRVAGDTATKPEAFLIELSLTELDVPGLRIDPPR